MTFPLGAPLLDACVLAVLEKEDAYGYSLTQRMKEVVELSESTLYPVLRRLQQSGCLTGQGDGNQYALYGRAECGRR